MKKRIVSTLCIVLAMLICMGVGAFAATNLQQIQAYLNYGVTVKLNGVTQTMYDAQGTRVYPISYKGTTYIPIRAVSNMLGIDVAWEQVNNTVLMGQTGNSMDFIESFEHYADKYTDQYSIADGHTELIAGESYDHYINMCGYMYGNQIYYDLGGKYSSLTFQLYSEKNQTVFFYGDNEELLDKITITGKYLPKTYTIDVTNVHQFSMVRETGNTEEDVYIFNTTIQ